MFEVKKNGKIIFKGDNGIGHPSVEIQLESGVCMEFSLTAEDVKKFSLDETVTVVITGKGCGE